jgi:hypothetical protein
MLGEGRWRKEVHGTVVRNAYLQYSKTDIRMIQEELSDRNAVNGLNWLKKGFSARLS